MSSLHGELQEAKKFISQATQPGIKALLQEYVLNIEQTLNKVAARSSDTATTPDSDNQTSSQQNSSSSSAAASTTTTTAPSIKQVSITSYSWDESETEVKLYLKLPSSSSAPSSSSSKQSPMIEKIIFSINSSTDEKSLNISFAVFFSPDKEGGNNMINSGELHSFAAHPTKHELENVLAMYEIPRQQQQQQDSSSSATTTNNHIFCTPNSTFVYPGEYTTPGGNLLRYCRLKIKPNGDVVVGIKKVMPQIWADLIDKDDFNKPLAFGNSGGRSRSDPGVQQSASLVSLMQQLYRDGDDEMRKTIANAWEESRSMPPPSEDDAVTIAADLQKKLAGGGGVGGNDAKNEAPEEK